MEKTNEIAVSLRNAADKTEELDKEIAKGY